MILSLSTCWNSYRHEDGYEMAQEIAGLGFEYMELSHGIRLSLVPGVLRAFDEGIIKVSSVHNFCPLPVGVNNAAPNYYQPTARDRRERDMWLRQSLKTLDFAARVRAPLVVLHSGSVGFLFRSPEARLEAAMEEKDFLTLREDGVFGQIRDQGLARLRKKQGPFKKRLLESFQFLAPFFVQRGLKAGVENREGFEELPLDAEMHEVLEELQKPPPPPPPPEPAAEATAAPAEAPSATEPDPAPEPPPYVSPYGYWHDAGHAQLKHLQGIIDHRSLLEQNHARQLGFHLHDVSVEGKDHQPLGTGTVDWDMVSSFFRPEHTLVLELSPRLSTEQIVQSRDFLHILTSRVGS